MKTNDKQTIADKIPYEVPVQTGHGIVTGIVLGRKLGFPVVVLSPGEGFEVSWALLARQLVTGKPIII